MKKLNETINGLLIVCVLGPLFSLVDFLLWKDEALDSLIGVCFGITLGCILVKRSINKTICALQAENHNMEIVKKLNGAGNELLILCILGPLFSLAIYLLFRDDPLDLLAGICFGMILATILMKRKLSKIQYEIPDENNEIENGKIE